MSVSLFKPNGEPWTSDQREEWNRRNLIQADHESICTDIITLPVSTHRVVKYADIPNPDGTPYPAYVVTIGDLDNGKPNILITAGVHGYEHGPVHAGIKFLREGALQASKKSNFVVFTCISPWAFERIQRRNQDGLDVNRGFKEQEEQAPECVAVMSYLKRLNVRFAVAVDLHETTTVEEEQRLDDERAEIEGGDRQTMHVPDGFYVYVSDQGHELGNRIVAAVGELPPPHKVASDRTEEGEEITDGVALVPPRVQGPCMAHMLKYAPISATTETCTEHLTMEQRADEQIAALRGVLDFVHG